MQQNIRGDLFRRLLQALFVICACLVWTGCLGPASAADAEQMTYDTATRSTSAAGARSYQILASEPPLRGHRVAYHLCEPGQGGQSAESIIGYQLVRNSWLTGEGGRYAERHQPVSGGRSSSTSI